MESCRFSHRDFVIRNLFLQKNRTYSHNEYIVKGERFYVDLNDTDHLIIKVSDFGESRTIREINCAERDLQYVGRYIEGLLNRFKTTPEYQRLSQEIKGSLDEIIKGIHDNTCKLKNIDYLIASHKSTFQFMTVKPDVDMDRVITDENGSTYTRDMQYRQAGGYSKLAYKHNKIMYLVIE